jgi:hypothetical protein
VCFRKELEKEGKKKEMTVYPSNQGVMEVKKYIIFIFHSPSLLSSPFSSKNESSRAGKIELDILVIPPVPSLILEHTKG